MMSVDEFRTLMKEDWQLSQFWCVASLRNSPRLVPRPD